MKIRPACRAALTTVLAAAIAAAPATAASAAVDRFGSRDAASHDPSAKIALAHRLQSSAQQHSRSIRSTEPDIARVATALAARAYVVLVAHTDSAERVSTVATAAARDGYTVRHRFGALQAVSVRVPRTKLADARAQLRALPGVTRVAQTPYRIPATVPNDPQYSQQSNYLSAIDLPSAWSRSTGGSTTTIAIIDTGVDTGHADLTGKVVGSYNAIDGSSDVTDADGHGTAVAGIAAASTNNGVGIAGAGWNTSLLAVKVAGADDVVDADTEAAGILWAASHGAEVINVSLAGAGYSDIEQEAVQSAQEQGALVIGAAGNDGTTTKTYPAAYPQVIAVGATDAAGHRAAFSGHGAWVTLGAPGVGIRTTVPTAASTMFPDGTDGYATLAGTSLAAPLVSAEAALLLHAGASAVATRAAILASASGYADQDLGAGQIDVAGAFDDVPPTTVPGAPTSSGTTGTITFTSHSTAPAVEFSVDGGAFSAPITVAHGVATFSWNSYGYGNGQHAIAAIDCTAGGACNPTTADASFTVHNAAPRITSPGGHAHVTGGFTITAAATGGGVEFLVDGSMRGFDGSAPYSFHYTGSALSEGSHSLQVVSCSHDGSRCYGPGSSHATIISNSLHPSISSLTPAPFSPNGNHVKDTTTLTYQLPDTEHVLISVFDYNGNKVRGPSDYGVRTKGTYTWMWDGRTGHGVHLPSGTYQVQVSTYRVLGGVTVRGLVGRHVKIDLSAPKLYSTSGGGTTFYPVADGYRDAFSPSTTPSEAGHITLQIKNSHGSVIRSITEYRHPSRVTIDWYGKNDSGTRVGAGTYYWSFIATDKAGNTRHGTTYRVYVSGERLVHREAVVKKNGDDYYAAGGSDSCAEADPGSSYYEHGLELLNTCGGFGEYSAVAEGVYKFGLPAAARYDRLKVRIAGYLFYSPSEVLPGFFRSDADYVDIPDVLDLGGQGEGSSYLGSASGAHHVNANHVTKIAVAVDGAAADVSDFDLKWVQVTAEYEVLQ